jgi:lipoprotein-releasing system ATP-binding protein
MSESVVRLEGVCKEFRGKADSVRILDGLDLEVGAGQIVAITGESGCGKSTLLSLLGGLDSVSSGSVECGEYRVSDLTETELTEYRKRFVGYVFQFHYLLRDLTLTENVMLPALIKGDDRASAQERARALLADVGLSHRAGYYPNLLSGGERQRAAVARALMNEPRLVLADEPTGNLDENNTSVVADALFAVARKYEKNLIFVTHDKNLARRADAVYQLTQGKLRVL